MKFERGRFSAAGLPAYLVIDEVDPDRPTGIVYRYQGRRWDQPAANLWYWEADGIYNVTQPTGLGYRTRRGAARGLLQTTEEAAS